MPYNLLSAEDGFPDIRKSGRGVFHKLYRMETERIAAGIWAGGEPPSLLLHSCCGPCSTAVVTRLAPFFRLTVFYFNPNLDTAEEYARRAANQRKFLDSFPAGGPEFPYPVSYIEESYDPAPFQTAASGLEDEPEGGKRCAGCFRLRLEKTAETAAARAADFFTTTLTVSPLKNAAVINRLGKEAADRAGVRWLWSDFKKEGGYPLSVRLSREYRLYRQEYCGCIFSRRDRETRR